MYDFKASRLNAEKTLRDKRKLGKMINVDQPMAEVASTSGPSTSHLADAVKKQNLPW